MPYSGSSGPASTPGDELHAGPDAARVLPAAARPGEPLAQDGARGDEAAFVLLERSAVSDCGLSGGAHADGDEARQQAGGDGQPRSFGDAVDLADEFEADAPARRVAQQVLQALAGAFHSRRDDARRDDGGLEQAEVVAGVVEDFGQVGDLGDRAEVDADQAQHRLVDDAEVGFDGRARRGVAPVHRQVDRDVEDARAFGEVHPQEEDVAPAAVREVHAHGRGFVEHRETVRRRSVRSSSRRTRSGWSAGWPMRNIHWLPRTERTLRRT